MSDEGFIISEPFYVTAVGPVTGGYDAELGLFWFESADGTVHFRNPLVAVENKPE